MQFFGKLLMDHEIGPWLYLIGLLLILAAIAKLEQWQHKREQKKEQIDEWERWN